MFNGFEIKRDIINLEKLDFSNYKEIKKNISSIENIYEDKNNNYFFRLVKKPYYVYKMNNELFVSNERYENDGDLNNVFTTNKGIFQCIDDGEFGGYLYLKTPFGNEYITNGNFKYLADLGEEILFVDSCSHLIGHISIGFIELNKKNIKFKILMDNMDEIFIDAFIENNEVYILSSKAIYKVNDKNIEIIINLEELKVGSFRNSNSIVFLGDIFYIGMNKQIITIDIRTKKVLIYTKESDKTINELIEFEKKLDKLFPL